MRLRFGAVRYRYYGGIYYREAPNGFVVVERPATVYVEDAKAETPFAEPEAQTILVKNTNGSETPVRLENDNPTRAISH